MQSRAQYRSCVHTQTMNGVPLLLHTLCVQPALFFTALFSHLAFSFFLSHCSLHAHTDHVHAYLYMVLIIQTKWLRYFYACSVLANYFYLPMIPQNSLKLLLINHERKQAHFYCYLFGRRGRKKKPNPRTMCVGLKRYETK